MRERLTYLSAVIVPLIVAWSAVGLGAHAAPGPTTPAAPAPPAQQESGEGANALCAVMTDEAIDPEIFTDYQGRKVYFCCRRCLRQFERDPQQYVVNLAAFSSQDEHAHDQSQPQRPDADDAPAQAAPQPGHEHEDGEHEHGGTDGHAHDSPEDSSERAEPSDHEHAHDHHGSSQLPAFLQWLGKFHPPSVNFPVGLLIAAALAEMLFMASRRQMFSSAARFCVWIGALGAVVAGSLGWLFGGIHLTDDDWIMTTHRWLGTSTASLALLLLVLSEAHHRQPEIPARRRWYRSALFVSAATVTATGFFGGAMIYGIDHYGW